ncbi:hypothetical protein KIPB_010078, partial [Kipferlia bialata]
HIHGGYLHSNKCVHLSNRTVLVTTGYDLFLVSWSETDVTSDEASDSLHAVEFTPTVVKVTPSSLDRLDKDPLTSLAVAPVLSQGERIVACTSLHGAVTVLRVADSCLEVVAEITPPGKTESASHVSFGRGSSVNDTSSLIIAVCIEETRTLSLFRWLDPICSIRTAHIPLGAVLCPMNTVVVITEVSAVSMRLFPLKSGVVALQVTDRRIIASGRPVSVTFDQSTY